MTSAKGSLLFLSNEWVVGTAFNVDRTYFGAQLASGEGVTLDWKHIVSNEHISQLGSQRAYIRGKNNRGRRQLEFGDIKGLVE